MDKGKGVALQPDPFVVDPLAEHVSTMIFLHGLGDKPEDLVGTVEYWRSHGLLGHVKFVLPCAPIIPFTAKVYDGSPNALQTDEDVDGILASRDYIHSLIKREIRAGIPASRILVGGFSQGGAVAVLAGLTYTEPLAGIVMLSAWLPLAANFLDHVPEDPPNRETVVFQCHGTLDRVVPVEVGKKSRDAMLGMKFKNSWDVYESVV
ncbi:phospholipase carboxylesterase [Trichoderma arundinaceum]|uniref:Acyl-protein thioesterase 1 n=1 Tax=Trichoderma arundinaceum TaxID=490622 RepID=A0A395NWE7_TRIAR|nr:phospholipase carboxylesterase [Trichoderma arundinaceum]